jgi:hypothetical protein
MHDPTSPLGVCGLERFLFHTSSYRDAVSAARECVSPSPCPLPWTWTERPARCQGVVVRPRRPHEGPRGSKMTSAIAQDSARCFDMALKMIHDVPRQPQIRVQVAKRVPQRCPPEANMLQHPMGNQ